jgi:hypothetical protein
MTGSVVTVLLYEDYVYDSLGNAMKAKQRVDNDSESQALALSLAAPPQNTTATDTGMTTQALPLALSGSDRDMMSESNLKDIPLALAAAKPEHKA